MSTAPPQGPPPVTGAWREGDPPGRRSFAHIGAVQLEAGGELPGVRVAYETWGRPDPARSNAVLVLHALTGDSHVVGPAQPGHPTPGWWDGLIGPGRAIDTDRWWVVAPNVLGGCQGSTGPASDAPDGRPWGSRFPMVTARDQVAAETALADALGVRQWACVLGGSMGGMRALEWAITTPDRVASLLLLACPAAASGEQIALCSAQLHAIRADPAFRGGDYYDAAPGEGPHVGLGVSRRVAQVSYRSEQELQIRFGRLPHAGEQPEPGRRSQGSAVAPGGQRGNASAPGGQSLGSAGAPGGRSRGRYAIESYLDHHADKLARRFDANSYVVLTESMNSHDVGRGRGGVEAALRRITARTLVAGIDSDRLYPPYQQEQLARCIEAAGPPRWISSPYGHDGFLLETGAVGALVTELLAPAAAHPASADELLRPPAERVA